MDVWYVRLWILQTLLKARLRSLTGKARTSKNKTLPPPDVSYLAHLSLVCPHWVWDGAYRECERPC